MLSLPGTPHHAFQRNTALEAACGVRIKRILLKNLGQSRPGSQIQSCTPKPALATSHEPGISTCVVMLNTHAMCG